MKFERTFLNLAWLALAAPALGGDFASLCADRAGIERVYHEHRTGTKPPFEQALPRERLERLVRDDLKKEAVLARAYGVKITDVMVGAEVARIHATTRAPEMLAEIKHALGDDAERFARGMARPILVERTLRARFDNDDPLHAPQRRAAEQARETLLARKPVEGMHDVTWRLTARPGEEKSLVENQRSESSAPLSTLNAQPSTSSSGSYSVEATAQIAQVLTPPPGERDRKTYFEDLDPELQKVLRVQLQEPGDASAVIETPGGFLLFQAKEKTAETLTATSFSIPKRSYEEWLAQQPEENP